MTIGLPLVSNPAIITQGLGRDFDDNHAVIDVDLEVATGEIYGFLGPNGAGKSTMVRMLCTLLAPSSGMAMVADYDVVRNPGAVRLRIGAALQSAALDPMQSGREILLLQGRLYGLSRAATSERIETLATLIDLGEALDDRIKTYSGGMKRRLDLAASLIHTPKVLFLDEPTTGLDPVSRNRIWEEVRRLNDEGMTIFLTTQYLEEADVLSDRVGIISSGRIVAEDSPDTLKRRYGSDVIVAQTPGQEDDAVAALRNLPGVERVERHSDDVMVVTPNASKLLSPVALALQDAGITVANLAMRTPTLDDVFLELTGGRLRPGEDE